MNKRAWVAEQLDALGATSLALELHHRVGSPWLPILTFHRICEPADALDPGVVDATPAELDAGLAEVARYFDPVGIADLEAYFAGGTLPPNPILVTFDDGYRDNHDVALPILLRHGVHAVFFVATHYIAARRVFWWDRIAYLVDHASRDQIALSYPIDHAFALATAADRACARQALLRVVKSTYGLDLERFLGELAVACDVAWTDELAAELARTHVMTWDHVRALRAAGMDVQSHSRTHRVLDTLALDDVAAELEDSARDLEVALGERPHAISYPVGGSVRECHDVLAAIRGAGYTLGFTNHGGMQVLSREVDRLDLARRGSDLHTPRALFRARLAMPRLFGYPAR